MRERAGLPRCIRESRESAARGPCCPSAIRGRRHGGGDDGGGDGGSAAAARSGRRQVHRAFSSCAPQCAVADAASSARSPPDMFGRRRQPRSRLASLLATGCALLAAATLAGYGPHRALQLATGVNSAKVAAMKMDTENADNVGHPPPPP